MTTLVTTQSAVGPAGARIASLVPAGGTVLALTDDGAAHGGANGLATVIRFVVLRHSIESAPRPPVAPLAAGGATERGRSVGARTIALIRRLP